MSGDRGSVSGVLVCWSLDLGSTPDGSLSFSFPLDHLGLSMLTTKLKIMITTQLDDSTIGRYIHTPGYLWLVPMAVLCLIMNLQQ